MQKSIREVSYGDEGGLDPRVVVERLDGVLRLAIDGHRGVGEVRELSRRVVAPDDHAVHLLRREVCPLAV